MRRMNEGRSVKRLVGRLLARLSNNHGFTMIEMIMVVIILGIIAVMGFQFVGSSATTYEFVTAEGKVASEAWIAMNKITREAAFSDLAYGDVNNISVPAFPVGAPTSDSTLTFSTITNNFPTGWNAAANCANCVDHSTTISYTLNGTQLIRNTAANNNQLLADGITAFTVTRTRADRAVPGGLSNDGIAGAVFLNSSESVTSGQAVDMLIRMTSGASNGMIGRISFFDSGVKFANIYPTSGPNAIGATNGGDAYTLSAHYLTVTITKNDPSSGISVTLTQTVYPNPNLLYPVN